MSEYEGFESYVTPPPVTESCPHGMALAAHNMCRYCIDEKLAEILKLLKARK